MGASISLRDNFDGASLRRLARTSRARTKRGGFWHWLRFMTAARIGGVGLQIVRDWVLRFNARGPDGLLDGKAHGRQSLLNDAERRALVEMVECGPIPSIHGVFRWRQIDLARWLYDEFAASLDATTVGRELKRLGYVKLTARPRHYA